MDSRKFASIMVTSLGVTGTRRAMAILMGAALAGSLEQRPAPAAERQRRSHKRHRGDRSRAAAVEPPGPPQPIDQTYSFDAMTMCTFPVTIRLTGKSKAIALAGGRLIFTAPGQKALLKNGETGVEASVSLTGGAHVTTLPDDNLEFIVTGNNIITDDIEVPHLALTSGRFRFVINPATGEVVERRSGNGRITDACALVG